MKDGDALMAAIIAAPEDDLPRLAYADWLEENGDAARAEFIRVQIALARGDADDAERKRLKGREEALLSEHRDEWRAPLEACGLAYIRFRRGFIERGDLRNEAAFLEKAAELERLTPLREVAIEWDFYEEENDAGEAMARLLASPAAARITDLQMGEPEGLPLLAILLASPNLTGVTTIRCDCLTDSGGLEVCRLVAGASQLTKLRSLTVRAYDVGDAGAIHLAEAAHLAALERLDLGDDERGSTSEIGPEGTGRLSRSPHLGRVRFLNLCGNPVGDMGMIYLSASQALASLEDLHLCGCGLTELGLRPLSDGRLFPSLKRLTLDVPELSSGTVDLLIGSPVLARLDWFYLGVQRRHGDQAERDDLFRARFGDEAYRRLKERFGDRIECTELEWDR